MSTEIEQLTSQKDNGVHITSITVKRNVEKTTEHVIESSKVEVNNAINNNNIQTDSLDIQPESRDILPVPLDVELEPTSIMSKVVPVVDVTSVIQQGSKYIDDLFPADSLWSTKRDGVVRLRCTEKGSGSETPQTVVSMLKNTATRIPKHAALCVKRNGEWKRWTFREYYDDACRVAKSFIKVGLEPYHGVGILGFNSPEWFLADIGCIFAGGLAVGIYTTNTPETCQFVATDSKANVIVVENTTYLKKILQFKDKLPDLKAIVQYTGEIEEPQPNLYTWEEFMKLGEDVPDSSLEERFQGLAPNKCCTIIYTSGTTGSPKGVMLSHDNVTWTPVNTAPLGCMKFGIERFVSYLPLSHVAAQYLDLYLPICFGSTVFFAQPDALKGSLVKTLQEIRPTGFMGVPRVWEKIMEKMLEIGRNTKGIKLMIARWAKDIGKRGNMAKMTGGDVPFGWTLASTLVFKKVKQSLGLDQCKIMFSGAAPINKETLEYFMSLDIMVDEVYGMSESSGPHSFSRPGCRRLTSVGSITPGTFVKITNEDEEGNGEICMYGRNIFMGYLDQEEKTKEVIDEEGWLRTGDIGRKDRDGFIFITGRLKEIIITAGGENIAPVPIEDSVKNVLPFVSDCMLIGDKQKFLSMMITIKSQIDPETQEPLDQLHQQSLDYCKSIGCSATTVSEMITDEAIKKAVQEGINTANKKALSRAANIQKWTILAKDFSLFGGELGPTLKLRRPIVVKMYEQIIKDMYQE